MKRQEMEKAEAGLASKAERFFVLVQVGGAPGAAAPCCRAAAVANSCLPGAGRIGQLFLRCIGVLTKRGGSQLLHSFTPSCYLRHVKGMQTCPLPARCVPAACSSPYTPPPCTQTDNLWKEHLQAIKFLQQAVRCVRRLQLARVILLTRM